VLEGGVPVAPAQPALAGASGAPAIDSDRGRMA
jgi:hypothetical protein